MNFKYISHVNLLVTNFECKVSSHLFVVDYSMLRKCVSFQKEPLFLLY